MKDIEYIEKKCKTYIKLVIAWSVFSCLSKYILNNEQFGLQDVLGSFVGEGELPVFWLIGALLMIYVVLALGWFLYVVF